MDQEPTKALETLPVLSKTPNIEQNTILAQQQNAVILARLDLSDLKLRPRHEKFIRHLVPANFSYNKAYELAFHKTGQSTVINQLRRNAFVSAAVQRLKKLVFDVSNEFGSWTFSESKARGTAYLMECDRELVRLNRLLQPLVEKIEKHEGFKQSLADQYNRLRELQAKYDRIIESGEPLDIEARKEYDKLGSSIDQCVKEMQSTSILTEEERKEFQDWSYNKRKWLTVAGAWKENLDKMHGYLTERKEIHSEVVYRELSSLSDEELADLRAKRAALDPSKAVQALPERQPAAGEGERTAPTT